MALAALFALGIQTAVAQPVNGCPAGQAMQSSDPSGRRVTCVAIPDAAALQSEINDEAAARKAADEELRASINEASIVGRYAMTGTQTCVSSSTNFNADLTPRPAPPGGSTVIQQTSLVTTGIRTFHADGTGTTEFQTQGAFFPAVFYNSNNFVGIGFNGAPPNPGGGVNVALQRADFTWQIVDGKLIIEDATSSGTFTRGTRAGWTLENRDVPRLVGILGKDPRTISLTHDHPAVETSVQTSPDGATVATTPRVCVRERLLRKLPPD